MGRDKGGKAQPRRLWLLALLGVVGLAACACLTRVAVAAEEERREDVGVEGEASEAVASPPNKVELPSEGFEFLEVFDTPWEDRWVVSTQPGYEGVFKHAPSEGSEDYGLLLSEKARKYGIARELPKAVEPKGKTTVLQYDVRFQNGLDCGGAYLKYLLPQDLTSPSKLKDDTGYSVMFGPDKCGGTNKVHFIFRLKNPKTDKYVEHHLKSPPTVPGDKKSHVYSAILNSATNTLEVLIDGEVKKTANLLEDFEPAVNPPKEIDDPNDKKPADWVENAKIADPEATKPDDWDEDAPMELVDEDAVMPEGWLVDEPKMIDDPEASKPDVWDEDEDGEWEPPKVPNPKCEEAPGCGDWVRPMKRNPAYKGKWSAPLIDNPAYKGPWKPRRIANPDYFEVTSPEIEPIAAVGIEVWTMSDGILFDNIMIGHDVDVAKEIREKTWNVKHLKEKEAEGSKPKDGGDGEAVASLRTTIVKKIRAVVESNVPEKFAAQADSALEFIEDSLVAQVVLVLVVPLLVMLVVMRCVFGGGAAKAVATTLEGEEEDVAVIKKKDIATKDDVAEGEQEGEEGKARTEAGEVEAAEGDNAAVSDGGEGIKEQDGDSATEAPERRTLPQRRSRRA
ncbi:hypothetical protein CBR_g37934 [Chara braunii]|uniref:Calnexin n=1 Tax=Chara braunii TaxID=69332 RepID=A0A388LP77_CHABU|nr:hypothetical protein CBR_g37934 [Chara braunii]|eukprot:GBG84059.1 hypothetical protein CBR_g37934 [Chara braunii]